MRYVPTQLLCPGLQRLLDVRRVVGLRNSAHSLVKLMNPCTGPAVVVSSYTHPEYAASMAATLQLVHATALLLRGTEGEPVADARRARLTRTRRSQHRTLDSSGARRPRAHSHPHRLASGPHCACVWPYKLAAMTQPNSSPTAHGSCTLVGAGPGDPELLTLRALKAIQRATVLLVDDLVSAAIVALASPTARVIHVGKRGGCKSTPQAFIEKLTIMAVREGETVVRLKGGDPFVFGRGGEEVENLRAAGVTVTVVNGITAGLAAMTSLGVPLTHREHAHGVVFVTGHAKSGNAGTDWPALAAAAHSARLTVVIYMGVACAKNIQDQLLSGLPASTPVAIKTPACPTSATSSARWVSCKPPLQTTNSPAPASSWWATCCRACWRYNNPNPWRCKSPPDAAGGAST